MGKSLRAQQELPALVQPALGVKAVYDIPLTSDLNELIINLSGTVNLTTGAAALTKDGILELIQSVDLIANGSDTIASIPFHQLVNGNMFRRRRIDTAAPLQPLLTIANQPFNATGCLDLAAFGAVRPKDSLVRETDYKTLQLMLRFAPDFTGVFNGGGFVVGGSVINVIVQAHETMEMADAQGKQTSPILRPLFSYREDIVGGAVLRERFRLTPDQALRGLTLRAVSGAGIATSDAVLGRVRIYTGKTLRYDKSAAGIRAQNIADMSSVIPTGYYYLDFASSGGAPDRLNDAYDLRSAILNGADAYLEYDSLAAMTLGVTQWGYQSPDVWKHGRT